MCVALLGRRPCSSVLLLLAWDVEGTVGGCGVELFYCQPAPPQSHLTSVFTSKTSYTRCYVCADVTTEPPGAGEELIRHPTVAAVHNHGRVAAA